MKKNGKAFTVATILLSANLLYGCSDDTSSGSATTEKVASAAVTVTDEETVSLVQEAVSYDSDDEYSDWENENPISVELNGTSAQFDSTAAVLFEDNVLTIKAGGTYVLSGILAGSIIVDAEDKSTVNIVLNGVEINASDTSAINVVNAEKTVISLPEGTENQVSDGETYVFADASEDEPNAAIFSKSDLTINGSGSLTVNGNYNNGISSKDELKITGGNLNVTAVDDGVMGRDLVGIKAGTVNIESGGDGIKSTNDEDETKGFIALEDGSYTITAANDGIQAETSLYVSGGTYTIASGGGSPETISNNEERMQGFGRSSQQESTTVTTETESESGKGLKASGGVTIGGGTFTIDSSDDAVHSNDVINIAGGEFSVASGDDGIHADTSISITGGAIDVMKSYEGIESQAITIDDGTIQLTSADDGINIGGGNDSSGMDMQASADGGTLTFNGGFVSVNASGDGLDANGSIAMTGGTVLVNGPTNDGNGMLDYDGSFNMDGGLMIAAGSAGMAQSASDTSAQSSVLMTYTETQAAGTVIHLEDSDGNTIVTFEPAKDYQSVFISSPELSADSSYTLYTAGTVNGTDTAGLYTEGEYSGGTKVVDFTISETLTYLNESGVTTGGNAGGPGGGFMPRGGERPTN